MGLIKLSEATEVSLCTEHTLLSIVTILDPQSRTMGVHSGDICLQ
jgi:hypothetical protein